MKYKVYIIYRREDAIFMDAVYNILSDYIDEDKIFVDTKSIYITNEPIDKIKKEALYSSENIVICINKFSFSRETDDWFYKEIDTALKIQGEGNVNLIPVINIRPDFSQTRYKMLSCYQGVDYSKMGGKQFRERLLEMVGINKNAAPTIIKNISIPENLVMRRDMLDKLDSEFKCHNCVVVSGIGGSGKTSLAYLYAKEQKFHNVAWVTVNGTIEDTFVDKIAEMLYYGEELENFMQNQNKRVKLAIVKNKLSDIKGKNLLVFDINTNNEEIKEEIETQIYKYLPSDNWKTLILTRTVARNQHWFASITMDRMTEDDAKELFTKNWTRTKIDFSQNQLAEITKELYYHPLLIEQTAIVFSKGHEKTADEIITKIKENSKISNPRIKKILSSLVIQDKAAHSLYDYLNLTRPNLNDDEIKFLACFITWPEEPIDYEVIETLLPDNEDILNSLVEKGILYHYNNDQYSIHSLMADVLREHINIKDFDYTEYFDNIQYFLADDEKNVTLHKYSKYIASSFINYGLCNSITLFRDFLYALCNVNDVILYNLSEPEFSNIVKKLEENSEPYQTAGLYHAVARVEEFKSNLSDAKSNYEKALEIMESVEENEVTMQSKGTYLYNLANLEEYLGYTDSAKKHYEETLAIIRILPKMPQYLYSLATTLHSLADLEQNLGDTDSAKNHYKETLKIIKILPKTPQYLYSLATTLHSLADLEQNLGDTYSAKNHYEETLKIIKILPETPQYLYSLATILNNLADLEENIGDTESAKKHFEESLETYRKLPETPQYFINFAATLGAYAMLEESLGDTDSAKKHFEEAVEISRQLNNERYINFFEERLSKL